MTEHLVVQSRSEDFRFQTLAEMSTHRVASLLRGLQPYRCAACVVDGPRAIGIAVSDPYLSVAQSRWVMSKDNFQNNLGGRLRSSNVGGLLVAWPLVDRYGRVHAQESRRRHFLAAKIQRMRGSVPFALLDSFVSLPEARRKHREEALWSDVGLETCEFGTPTLDIIAAVQLQTALDKEFGGWPNTFG